MQNRWVIVASGVVGAVLMVAILGIANIKRDVLALPGDVMEQAQEAANAVNAYLDGRSDYIEAQMILSRVKKQLETYKDDGAHDNTIMEDVNLDVYKLQDEMMNIGTVRVTHETIKVKYDAYVRKYNLRRP